MTAGNDNMPGHVRAVIATAALAEARDRGWTVHLVDGQPAIAAPLATMSPALVERLCEFADAVAHVLALEEERCR